MTDASPPQHNEEQYPLLKVDEGGDGRPPPPSANGWSVTMPGSAKKSWIDRLPELLSACWMTGMLLGIFLLILFGLGLGVLRRQPLITLSFNDSLSAKEVHYHYIVPSGSAVPFSEFSEYLSHVASLYSSLRFNVNFLVDDALQSSLNRNTKYKFIGRLISFCSNKQIKYDDNSDLETFLRKYENVNVTVMPLSKFMAQIPLRYKWRTIAKGFLTFYARVFAVWQRGGIGMDLDMFNKQFRRHHHPDRRIETIMKQHNNGIANNEYETTLKDEQADINYAFQLIHKIMHYPLSLNTLDIPTNHPNVSPRHRRDIRNTLLAEDSKTISSQDNKVESMVIPNNATNITIDIAKHNSTSPSNTTIMLNVSSSNKNVTLNNSNTFKMNATQKNIFEPPQIVLYDIYSLFYDNIGPSYFEQEPSLHFSWATSQNQENDKTAINHEKFPSVLSLSLDGSFIAAFSKQHSLLTYMISSGCQRMNPAFVIQDAITHANDDIYYSIIYKI